MRLSLSVMANAEMKIMCAHTELADIDLLVPNPKNPNKHPKDQIKLLAKIMAHQGWRSPVVVSNRSGFIVKGHGRLEAAKMNGWDSAPVDRQDYASDADEYADMVADNKIAELSDTDLSMVLKDVLDLGPDFDFDLLGIPDFKLPEEFEPQSDEDEVPAAPVEPKTKRGDIYQLGRHRLMCGDSTSIDDVEKLMAGEKIDIVVTSPPYNSGDGGYKTDYSGETKKFYTSKVDDRTEEEWVEFCNSILCNIGLFVRDEFSPVIWNVMYTARCRRGYGLSLFSKNQPFQVHETICWDKLGGFPSASKGILSRKWELVFVMSKGQKYHTSQGQNEVRFNKWEIESGKQHEIHKATFPLGLVEKSFEWFGKSEGTVYEPFCGSGTTLIAAEKFGKSCFGMELDPLYCDVIVARWEKYTGKKAELVNG